MSDLLLELFSEEMPAGMQGRATRDLEKLLGEALTRVGLTHGTVETFVTPRRLTIAVADIPEKSPDISEERKGPRVGAPEKAIAGFLKSAGLESLDQCEIKEDKKGQYYAVALHHRVLTVVFITVHIQALEGDMQGKIHMLRVGLCQRASVMAHLHIRRL